MCMIEARGRVGDARRDGTGLVGGALVGRGLLYARDVNTENAISIAAKYGRRQQTYKEHFMNSVLRALA